MSSREAFLERPPSESMGLTTQTTRAFLPFFLTFPFLCTLNMLGNCKVSSQLLSCMPYSVKIEWIIAREDSLTSCRMRSNLCGFWVSQFLACLTKENSHRKSNELYNDEKKRNFSLKLNFKPSFFLSESWTEVTKITKQSFIRVLWDEKWSSRGEYSKKRNPRKECWKEKQKVSLHSWWISSFLSVSLKRLNLRGEKQRLAKNIIIAMTKKFVMFFEEANLQSNSGENWGTEDDYVLLFLWEWFQMPNYLGLCIRNELWLQITKPQKQRFLSNNRNFFITSFRVS